MKVYCVVNNEGQLLFDTMISTHDRAAQTLRDFGVGEEDGYFIQERDIPEDEYFKVLAIEAQAWVEKSLTPAEQAIDPAELPAPEPESNGKKKSP
jgi:hypothetical protein